MPACDALVVSLGVQLRLLSVCLQEQPARWWTFPERTCNGRVDSVSRSDLLLKKETLARVGGRHDKSHGLRTLAAAADLWQVTNGIPSTERNGRGCPALRN